MRYTRSLELELYNWKLVPFNQYLFSPTLQGLANTNLLSVSESDFSGSCMSVRYYSVCFFLTRARSLQDLSSLIRE